MRPELPSDPPLSTIDVDGVTVGFVDEGSGPAVLALHGLPGSHRDFRWLASACTDRVRLVRVDLPGFGRSARGPTTWPELAAFVRRAAIAIVGAPHLVLGHSFGAPLASMVAALGQHDPTAPVRGVAWIAPVGLRQHQMLRRGIGLRGLGAIDRAARARVVGPAVVNAWRRILHRTGFPSSVTISDTRQTLAQLGAFAFELHRAAVAELDVPSLVAWAQDDPFVEGAVVEELARAAGSRLRIRFARGGHNVQKTQAVELAAALAELATAGGAPGRGDATMGPRRGAAAVGA